MMTPSRLERGSNGETRLSDFGADRSRRGERQTALRRRRMETFWKNEGAPGRKPFERFKPRDRLNKPSLFATGCRRLPFGSHGKQGVCRGLPPVAGGPLPAKEGVDL
jgi:hypothetical protein